MCITNQAKLLPVCKTLHDRLTKLVVTLHYLEVAFFIDKIIELVSVLCVAVTVEVSKRSSTTRSNVSL